MRSFAALNITAEQLAILLASVSGAESSEALREIAPVCDLLSWYDHLQGLIDLRLIRRVPANDEYRYEITREGEVLLAGWTLLSKRGAA